MSSSRRVTHLRSRHDAGPPIRTKPDWHGPVLAVLKLLNAHGLKVDDIGLWELNGAFACQAIYYRDILGIDPEITM